MTHVFNPSNKIGEIVAELPKAVEVFGRYKVDFCCGGNRALGEAIAEQGLDTEQILTALDEAHAHAQALKEQKIDWRTAPFVELVDYIVNSHHAYMHTTLPELSQITTTILRVHGAGHKELSKVHRLFHSLKLELEQHLITEEEVLFPLVKEYEETKSEDVLKKAIETIDQLESEHEGAGDILKELREITQDYAIPADACGTYERTYAMLQEMENDLFQHIHLENNILHPRLKALLAE